MPREYIVVRDWPVGASPQAELPLVRNELTQHYPSLQNEGADDIGDLVGDLVVGGRGKLLTYTSYNTTTNHSKNIGYVTERTVWFLLNRNR